ARGTPLALEETPGELAGGVGLFPVINGEGEEIGSHARLGADRRAQNHAFAIMSHHGAVSLLGNPARLEHQLAPADFGFNANNSHVCLPCLLVDACHPCVEKTACRTPWAGVVVGRASNQSRSRLRNGARAWRLAGSWSHWLLALSATLA